MAVHATVAPWAEEVLSAPFPMTIADLLTQLEDAQWKYELVHGRLVRTPASDTAASAIAARLISALEAFVAPRGLGRVTGTDGAFNLTSPGAATATGFVPDVAFVRASRLPQRRLSGSPLSGGTLSGAKKALRLAPDLAVEVAVARQTRSELLDKLRLYLGAGVRLVWIIWPAQRRVDVWMPPIPIAGQPAAQLTPGDVLDGLHVVPGFTFPVADLLV